MKKQDAIALKQMATQVGHFIRYWGFRKIHGEIWTLLYLAKKPLSGVELIELLGVSKALVSPALKELHAQGLINEVPSENAKVKRYAAVEDVGAVIKRILQTRERQMMDEIQIAFDGLDESRQPGLKEFVDSDRLLSMGEMIQAAHFGLSAVLESEFVWK